MFLLKREVSLGMYMSCDYRAGHTGGPGGMAPPPFCVAKRKNENKGKNRKDFKAELFNGCHQG